MKLYLLYLVSNIDFFVFLLYWRLKRVLYLCMYFLASSSGGRSSFLGQLVLDIKYISTYHNILIRY